MVEKLIKSLQEKHDGFIGNRKDEITSANAEGFKDGLSWAIGTAMTLMQQEASELEYDQKSIFDY